jgi:hypothetical protein
MIFDWMLPVGDPKWEGWEDLLPINQEAQSAQPSQRSALYDYLIYIVLIYHITCSIVTCPTPSLGSIMDTSPVQPDPLTQVSSSVYACNEAAQLTSL